MADKKISELDQTLNLDEQAEFPLSQDNGGTPTTFKAKLTQIATKIIEAITFSNLTTTSKTVIGAINELDAGGGGGGASELNDLDDVNISSPTDGQALVYDDVSDKWVNGDVAAEFDITTAINTPASIQTFSDGGDNIPMKSCEVAIVAVETGTGQKSPSNPYTLTGFNSVALSVSSKNLWANGDVSFTGNNKSVYLFRPLPPATYTISAIVTSTDTDASTCLMIVYYTDGTNSGVLQFNRETRNSKTLTVSKTIERITFYSSDNYNHGNGDTATWSDIQIETGDQMTAYEAPQVTPVSLGQTIYGGTADVVNGTGIKTHENIASYNGESINEPWICSEAPFVSGTTPPTGSQVVYPLTTPTAFTFTGANIPTLSGTNNVYADSGDINSLEYFNDKGDDIADLHNALGEPLHIYSTDEKVVGKWIDGSDVYERTFELTNEITLDVSNWTSLGVSVSGVDKPIGVEARSSRAINSSVVVDLLDSPITAKGLDKIKSLTIRYTKSSS